MLLLAGLLLVRSIASAALDLCFTLDQLDVTFDTGSCLQGQVYLQWTLEPRGS